MSFQFKQQPPAFYLFLLFMTLLVYFGIDFDFRNYSRQLLLESDNYLANTFQVEKLVVNYSKEKTSYLTSPSRVLITPEFVEKEIYPPFLETIQRITDFELTEKERMALKRLLIGHVQGVDVGTFRVERPREQFGFEFTSIIKHYSEIDREYLSRDHERCAPIGYNVLSMVTMYLGYEHLSGLDVTHIEITNFEAMTQWSTFNAGGKTSMIWGGESVNEFSGSETLSGLNYSIDINYELKSGTWGKLLQ